MKKLISWIVIFFLFLEPTFAFKDYFAFWLRLQENEYDLVPKIEKQFWVRVPVVSVIYDDFEKWEIYKLAKTFKTLWTDRIYHISINPFWHNLLDLINSKDHWGWEKKYRNLFKMIKRSKVKVIFRSLHEMNWWWYSWSSDPANFKIFWRMMWNWSREEWLTKADILFDMSVNSQDLPAVDPSNIYQWWPVITCNQWIKDELGCHTFEDYYPWDEYVDLVWVTIYNWWDWARKEPWAKWRDPMNVIDELGYYTFWRMKKLWKPIFIDEAGSTSIDYHWDYDEFKLIDLYKEFHTSTWWVTATWTLAKDKWISKLPAIYTDPQVLWGAYFNADVTNGLNDRSQIWELDWTAIDPVRNFAYPSIISLLNDYRNMEFPTFYFDVSDETLKSRDWITDVRMEEIHAFISKYIVYKEWNLIMNPQYEITQKYPKYQLYLEKQLAKDPILCAYVNSKFKEIKCPIVTVSDYREKKAMFDMLSKNIESSPILLSNWWVWDQIEQIKNIVYWKFANVKTWSKWEKSRDIMIDYLNSYEKTFLDLR